MLLAVEKAQGKKDLNGRTQRKEDGTEFAKSEEFSGIALQSNLSLSAACALSKASVANQLCRTRARGGTVASARRPYHRGATELKATIAATVFFDLLGWHVGCLFGIHADNQAPPADRLGYFPNRRVAIHDRIHLPAFWSAGPPTRDVGCDRHFCNGNSRIDVAEND
jgi:hypothetical protein